MVQTKFWKTRWWSLVLGAALLLGGCGPDIPYGPDGPDGPDTPEAGRVVMNEINTSAKYIELYNPGDQAVDLGGMKIRKNNEEFLSTADGTDDLIIPAGTMLEGKSYAVLGCKGNTIVHEGLDLGTSHTGLSGSKSLLLELLDKSGNRLDYFVNTLNEHPVANDEWGGSVEHAFDVAARINDGTDGWWVTDRASPGQTNNLSTPIIIFANTEMDWTGSGEGFKTDEAYVAARDYVFDLTALPEITISVELDEWNRLLALYDQNSNTKQYVHCDVNFRKGNTIYSIDDAGLRLRGNTSRRRPEGNSGQAHVTDNTDWHHCHFGVNLRKYVKNDAHTIMGVRKMHLKWFKDDPTYVREIYCYDLFRRFGIWTAIRDSYCRLNIHVEGDSKPAYYGVYGMLEGVDDEYLRARRKEFGGDSGNLWKCSHGADLHYTDSWKFGYDQDTDEEWIYELKTENASFAAAKAQLVGFINKLNSLKGQEFHDWIAKVTDVELLLRTYAVNVIVGMWDDYWNNSNNYYIYFNNTGENYKFFLIPYDYDNTLGTSHNCGVITDSGTHDPLQWGDTNQSPLIGKILAFDDYRAIYIKALNELISPKNSLFHYGASMARISDWQSALEDYVDNDTNEDTSIYDAPASWGNQHHYRITVLGNNNFFQTKAASIPTK